MSLTFALVRLNPSIASEYRRVNRQASRALSVEDPCDRTRLSSVSGRGPKYRSRQLPERRPAPSAVAPAETTPSIAPGIRSPAGPGSRNLAFEYETSASRWSHRAGV